MAASDTLYEEVKEKICRKIFDGTFPEGEKIPAERTLAEMLGVSRITVRKSLELLEQQGLITREVGSGTRVQLPGHGTPSEMDMIVLVAPSQNPFFSDFIRHFQAYGQQHDIMILYAEKPRAETLEESIYRFYSRRLQNVVIWAENTPIDRERFKRLRALGMNMVFFDTDAGIPYTDCVTLDNRDAIHRLCRQMREKGAGTISYIGWEGGPEYSITQREQALLQEENTEIFCRIPWSERADAVGVLQQKFEASAGSLPKALLMSDRESGEAAARALLNLGIRDRLLGSVDEFPEAAEFNSCICKQDIKETIEEIYACLKEQNERPMEWKARTLLIPGIVG